MDPNLKLRKVPMEQATAKELIWFAANVENIELEAEERRAKSTIVSKLRASGVGQFIYLPEPGSEAAPARSPGANDPEMDRSYDPERERWAYFKISHADGVAPGGDVKVSINDETAILPRGVPVICRERFYYHLAQSKRRVARPKDSSGDPDFVDLKEMVRVDMANYPTELYGYLGLVKEGGPTRRPKGAFIIGLKDSDYGQRGTDAVEEG